MNNLENLFVTINKLLETNPGLILAIDGNAASGKTTLANILQQEFNALIFHMDDFFLPAFMKTPERLAIPGENIHWERFLGEVLIPLKNQEIIQYISYDCKTDSFAPATAVIPEGLTVVEGVYSMHKNLLPYYDLKIFVSLDEKTQHERLKKRENPVVFHKFTQEWLPMENAYFQTFNIQDECDLVLSGKNLL